MSKVVPVRFQCDPDFFDVFPEPGPSSKFIPDYYRDMPSSVGGHKSGPVFNDNGDLASTMKRCMPVFDSLTAGYVIPLPTDIYVSNNADGGKSFVWSADNFGAVSSHPAGQFPGLDVGEEYNLFDAFKFTNPWQVVTPEGYSCLFVQPFWRYDVPFHVFPGVVDTDKHPVPVNFPFVIRKDFEGYIPKGTPIVQVIPFRRESFQCESGVRPDSENKRWAKAKLQFSNRYKNSFRSVKSYR
jgi:hypothetical protein